MNEFKLSMSKVAKDLTRFFYKKREKEAMQWLANVTLTLLWDCFKALVVKRCGVEALFWGVLCLISIPMAFVSPVSNTRAWLTKWLSKFWDS
jgi:hypothetical protein